jgi:NAD(P)H-dependent FMN reductase
VSTLGVVIASVRPGRVGLPVGRWAAETAAAHGGFQVEVADLAELGLPLMDEPHHPRLGPYVHEHTLRWSAYVDAADAFLFVTPEYNHGPAASLLNAISYLYHEWLYKPIGFVSYGGPSGGMRAVEAVKPVVSRLSMVALHQAVAVPYVDRQVVDNVFKPSSAQKEAADRMLDELLRWTEALLTLREVSPAPGTSSAERYQGGEPIST